MSRTEFLRNSPKFPNSFTIRNDKTDFIVSRKEMDHFILHFYTNLGKQYKIPVEDVWGYCDGYSIYLNYKGRPYQLVHLGQISILRFEKTYYKQQTARFISLVLTGNSLVEVNEQDYLFYNLKEDQILPFKESSLSRIISKDPELFEAYINEKKRTRWAKRLEYILNYNKTNSIKILEEGIEIN